MSSSRILTQTMPSWWTVTFLLLATTSEGFAPRRRRTYQSSPRLRAGETTEATSATDVGVTTTATPPPPASYGGIDGNRFPYGDPSNVDRLFSNLNYEKTSGAAGGGNSDGVGRALVAERKEGSLLAATSLVTGTTIGAGILALPAVSLPAGTIPSTLVLVACWAYMAASGLLVAEVNLNSIFASGRPGFSVLSMTRLYLGEAGGLLSGAAYVFIHYALLVAYIAQGGGVLGEVLGLSGGADGGVIGEAATTAMSASTTALGAEALLSQAGGPVLFTALFGGLLAFGSAELVDALNSLFVACVLGSFVVLLALAAPQVQPEFLLRQDWAAVVPAVPTMIVALVFHNVVPVITTQLEGDREKVSRAILLGSAIPLLMFVAWNLAIVGSVPPDALASFADGAAAAAASGLPPPPPFDPLEQLRGGEGGPFLSVAVSTFSEFAIVTSFIGFVLGLQDFFRDAFASSSSSSSAVADSPSVVVAEEALSGAGGGGGGGGGVAGSAVGELGILGLVLVPPMLFALVDPDVFFGALDSAGTFGISTLFGLVPAIMAWKQRYGDEETGEVGGSNGDAAAVARGGGDGRGADVLVAPPMVPGGRVTLAAMMTVALAIIGDGVAEKVSAVVG
jgi:tyrosine-specific transport protein